jgi:hypothetical protein
LPSSHCFFHDQLGSSSIDPLLFLEIARQATIASAHELEVDADSILILTDFELILSENAMDGFNLSETCVFIESHFDWTSVRRGVARAGRCDQKLSIGDRLIAEHWSSGRILTRSQLAAIRSEYRGSTPPISTDVVDSAPVNAVVPSSVGRANPLNVVISNLSLSSGRPWANVSPRLCNKALFDHSYDHVTMQVLTEAARQLHITEVSRSGLTPEINSIRGHFKTFAELDSELLITSPRDEHYSIIQNGQLVAEFVFNGSNTERR